MITNLSEIKANATSRYGGKAAQLGELLRLNLPVPSGFAIDVTGYQCFLKENSISELIESYILTLNKSSIEEVRLVSSKITSLISTAKIPSRLMEQIKHYSLLLDNCPVAVRSSATLEDSFTSSFAGQLETILDVQGIDQIEVAIRQCWASLWSVRALMYRINQGLSLLDVSMAVIIQKLIYPNAAGVMFTVNPLTKQQNEIYLEGVRGFGEGLVSGRLAPDRWLINKTSLEILESHLEQACSPVIDFTHVQKAVELAITLEKHFNYPLDIEWAYADGQFYLLQARPITTL